MHFATFEVHNMLIPILQTWEMCIAVLYVWNNVHRSSGFVAKHCIEFELYINIVSCYYLPQKVPFPKTRQITHVYKKIPSHHLKKHCKMCMSMHATMVTWHRNSAIIVSAVQSEIKQLKLTL
jgi:hypothetical protein